MPLSRLIDSVGMSYDDFAISNLNPEAGAAALAARKVDALFTIQGYALEERGIGKIVWSTAEAPVDWKMRAELWAAKELRAKEPRDHADRGHGLRTCGPLGIGRDALRSAHQGAGENRRLRRVDKKGASQPRIAR